MIANNLIKQGVVQRLRVHATLTSLLPDGIQGVREVDWRGTDYGFPNVRVQIDSNVDATPETNCTPTIATFSVFVLSEKHSSQECDNIASIAETYLRGSSFTINTVKFNNVKILELIPAVQEDVHTWRAQVRCQSIIYTV